MVQGTAVDSLRLRVTQQLEPFVLRQPLRERLLPGGEVFRLLSCGWQGGELRLGRLRRAGFSGAWL